MHAVQRILIAGAFAVATAGVATLGVTPRPSQAAPGAAAVPSAAVPFPRCVPAAHGVLKDPPLWTPSPANSRTIVLHARVTGETVYCYVVDGQTDYFEAPTIQVHAGETFYLVLKNELNAGTASSAPHAGAMAGAHAAPPAADGCNQLGTSTRPPDNSGGVLGLGPTPDPRLRADMAEMKGDTNLHTHGWDVSPSVDNVFKSTIGSTTRWGAHSCRFAFAVPVTQSPGTYWYHSHLHGDSENQVGGGLAGALVVLPPASAQRVAAAVKGAGLAATPRILLLKNMTPDIASTPEPLFLKAGGANNAMIALGAGPAAGPTSSPTFPPVTVPGKVWSGIPFDYAKSGDCSWPVGTTPEPKPGQQLMVNGIPIPPSGSAAAPPVFRVPQAERVRVINASADSYVSLTMTVGASGNENLQVLARDGVDLDARAGESLPLPFPKLLLGPGNRADLLIAPENVDRTLTTSAVCTGGLGNPERQLRIVTIPRAGGALRANAVTRTLQPAQTQAAAFVTKYQGRVLRRRELTFTQYDAYKHFYVTDTTNRNAPGFGERPFWLQPSTHPSDPDHYMLPNITVTQDDTEIWTLTNASAEIHAFHIHQMTFKVLSTDDPDLMSQFKDVLLDVVPLAPGRAYVKPNETSPVVFTDTAGKTYPALTPTHTQILINFGVVHPGTFVYHCHMLAHEDSGMMGIITVLPRGTHAAR